ncbi:hypothetical protein IJG04_03325 [Candidatus Saccharibacteria bacterium]|nr:hypothetical protein [Candidatus Saccharibacteria bacterium]
MNKKYMDFVPVRKSGGSTRGSGGAGVVGSGAGVVTRKSGGVDMLSKKVIPKEDALDGAVEVDDFVVNEVFEERHSAGSGDFGRSSGVKLGVIEDLSPRFVKTEVPKRALGDARRGSVRGGAGANASASAKEAKKVVVKAKNGLSVAQRPMGAINTADMGNKAGEDKQVLKVPKFVNTDKLNKRPLSKNVYSKRVVESKEEPQGPVTIIARPEKDSKVGMVVAVVITVILGAAAGIVAFLLLPK